MAQIPEVRIQPDERIAVIQGKVRRAALPDRYRKLTTGRRLLNNVGRAAVAGFGLSLGRDVYRKAKGLARLLLMLALPFLWIILPYFGVRLLGRNRTIGYDIAGALATIVGWFFALFLASILVSLGNYAGLPSLPRGWPSFALATLLIIPGVLVGLRHGQADREIDEAAETIADRNLAFLARHGIRETGGRDITHYDGEGSALRFLETHDDRMIFLAVGRRNRRATIFIDPNGLMTAYTRVVPL